MDDRNATAVQTQVSARIALSPADWAIATWRPRQPVVRPAAQPFDRARCLIRLRTLSRGSIYHSSVGWLTGLDTSALSPQEAHFWFTVLTESPTSNHPGALPTDLEKCHFTGQISRDEICQRLRQRAGYLQPEVMWALSGLLDPVELLEVLLDEQLYTLDYSRYHHYQFTNLRDMLIDGFRRHVLPYLDDAPLEQLRQYARSRIPSSLWSQPAAPTMEQSLAYRLAPMLGLHRELLSLVSSWPKDLFRTRGGYSGEEWRRWPREMIFGLGDPCLVEQHMRRLDLPLRDDADARAWLAHTETRALDYLRDSALSGARSSPHRVIEALCAVESPEAARPLMELRLAGQSCPALQRWFSIQLGNAVAGLLPLAGGRGKLADAVRNYLREVKRRGFASVIEEQLAHLDAPVVNRVRQTVLSISEVDYPTVEESAIPSWLRQGLRLLPEMPSGQLPDWVVVDDLPSVVIKEGKLARGHVCTLIRVLQTCKLDGPPLLIRGLRQHVELGVREVFVWRLIEQWLCAGAPPRDSWALHAAGWLGGDESVLKLAGLLRDWTGPAGRYRSLVALDCIQAIGTSMALQQLSALSRQVRSRPLRQRARELVETAARHRGLSRTELEDQVVPTLGFEGANGPVFDFGPRQFQAVLAPGLRVMVRDTSGAVRAELPAPGVRDDRDRASAAIAGWRLLRKSVREVFKEQAARLERAMVSGQRWPMRYFYQGILRQPLLAHLARQVLWGGFDDRGRLSRIFRITDDLSLVGIDEKTVSLADVNSIRVVHPIELDEAARTAWSAVWRDHELIAPFPQLGRRLFLLTPEQREAKEITVFRGRRVPALTLSGHVKSQDWQPAVVGTAGPGEAHVKIFRAANLTAVLRHPNVGEHTYPNHLAEQELHSAFFVRGTDVDREGIKASEAIPLGEVPNLVRSEVCEVMAWLYAKGKE